LSGRKTRGIMHPYQFLIDEDTKDMVDDLITEYGDEDVLMKTAIEALHRKHYGSASEEKSIPRLAAQTPIASERLELLMEDVAKILAQPKHYVPVQTTSATSLDNEKQVQLTQEANEKILSKIDELGVKFSKQTAAQVLQTNGTKHMTTEMSNEEVIQLLKRLDQLETKLTRAISETSFTAARSSGPTRSGPLRELGDAPKISAIKDGDMVSMDDVERPLLDDVLDTVIVSVENE